MAKMSQLAAVQEQRVCVFGPPKSGKTELAARLAEHYRILYFGLENGHMTMAKLPPEWQDRIEIINIRDSREYPIAAETMLKVIKGGPTDICVAHSKVSCPLCKKKEGSLWEHVHLNALGPEWIVIIDSLTQLTNSFIAHVTKGQDDLYKLQLDDWGALKVLMDKFLSQVQVAPYNVVCITHEEEVKFEDGRAKIVPVAGSANSSRNTAKYFDHIVYCNVVNKKHVVGSATDYSMSVLTGSRTDVKLEATKVANLLDVFTTWKDKINWGEQDARRDVESPGISSVSRTSDAGINLHSINSGSSNGNSVVDQVPNTTSLSSLNSSSGDLGTAKSKLQALKEKRGI